MLPVNAIIPLNACRSHAYIYDLSKIPPVLTPEDWAHGLRFGANVDTEFKELPTSETVLDGRMSPRQGVTVQISGVLAGPELIFCHPDHEQYAKAIGQELRHPVMRSGCIIVEYLQAIGGEASLRRHPHQPTVDRLPAFQADFYAFFANAEATMIFTGDYKQDIVNLALKKCLTQQRRLTTRDVVGEDNWQLDYCRLPWILTLNGLDYGVQLRWIDVGALHGIASYRDLLVNTGLPVDDKDLMKELGMITRMDEAYFLYPEEFDAYAKGDLKIYQALVANNETFRKIYAALGYDDRHKVPHLTIGRTIVDIGEAGIGETFHTDPSDSAQKKDILGLACSYGTAEHFRVKTDKTSALLAKVPGGRCINHRPTLASSQGVWLDQDLAGCYAQGLRVQDLPFGRPFVVQYDVDTAINDYRTLRAFLHDRHHNTPANELVPGLWMAYVTMRDGVELDYPQTFFPSYFGFNAKKRIVFPPSHELIWDLQDESYEFDVNTGHTKICTHRIEHSVLTEDSLDWILYACHPQQRDELLDKLYVVTAAYYKRSERVDTVDELLARWGTSVGRNTCTDEQRPDANGIPVTTRVETNQECYAWTSKRLDALLIDQLLANRQLYPKKTPLNNMFKLVINGLFGDMVSPYFQISNTIVGANITRRGFAGCWYTENSFNGVQSITDGCQLNLNEVVTRGSHPKHGTKLNAYAVYKLRYEHASMHANIRLRPLAGYDKFTLTYELDSRNPLVWNTGNTKVLHRWKDCQDDPLIDTLQGFDAEGQPLWSHTIDAWINPTTLRHMQDLWSTDIRVLHGPSTSLKVRNARSQQAPPIIEYVDRTGTFEFEMKDLYTDVAFHSAANHLLVSPWDEALKYRSYKKRTQYDAYRLDHGVIIPDSRYAEVSPPLFFLRAVLANPHAVPRGLVYCYNKMIKPDEFTKRYESFFQFTSLTFGDSYVMVGLLKEFSLSQFSCKTPAQWLALNTEYERCKERYGQYVECYFLNADGTLDYQRMLIDVQKHIDTGCDSLIKALDPHNNFAHKGGIREHRQFAAFRAVKEHLQRVYGGYVEYDDDMSEMYDGPMEFIVNL